MGFLRPRAWPWCGTLPGGRGADGATGIFAGTNPQHIFSRDGDCSATSDDPDPVASSEHFELVYPDLPGTLGEANARHVGTMAEGTGGARGDSAAARTRAQLGPPWANSSAPRDEPGWMAAASDGQSIALQPLELLARKQILNQTLRHELTHLVVHRLRAKDVPRWFEEGLVLYLTGERIEAPAARFKTTRGTGRGHHQAAVGSRDESRIRPGPGTGPATCATPR